MQVHEARAQNKAITMSSPVSTLGVSNAWDHYPPFGEQHKTAYILWPSNKYPKVTFTKITLSRLITNRQINLKAAFSTECKKENYVFIITVFEPKYMSLLFYLKLV